MGHYACLRSFNVRTTWNQQKNFVSLVRHQPSVAEGRGQWTPRVQI